jgi:UrcA family protein
MKTETHPSRSMHPQTAIRAAALFALLALAPAAFADAPAVSGPDTRAAKAPPPATPPLAQMSVLVKVGDLDLTTESGVRSANERIRAAAGEACTFTTNMGHFVVGGREVYRKCFNRTVSNAAVQLEHARLAAWHNRDLKIAGN